MKKVLCILTRHLWEEIDWYSFECTRCGAYFGGRDWEDEPFSIGKTLAWLRAAIRSGRFPWGKVFSRCCDCRRPEWILGRPVGKHDDCIPF